MLNEVHVLELCQKWAQIQTGIPKYLQWYISKSYEDNVFHVSMNTAGKQTSDPKSELYRICLLQVSQKGVITVVNDRRDYLEYAQKHRGLVLSQESKIWYDTPRHVSRFFDILRDTKLPDWCEIIFLVAQDTVFARAKTLLLSGDEYTFDVYLFENRRAQSQCFKTLPARKVSAVAPVIVQTNMTDDAIRYKLLSTLAQRRCYRRPVLVRPQKSPEL